MWGSSGREGLGSRWREVLGGVEGGGGVVGGVVVGRVSWSGWGSSEREVLWKREN